MTKTSSNSQLSSTLYCVQENKQRGWQVVGKNSSEIGETRLPMTYCTHLRRDPHANNSRGSIRYFIVSTTQSEVLKHVTVSTASAQIATGEQAGGQQDHSGYCSGSVDRDCRLCHLDRGRPYRW